MPLPSRSRSLRKPGYAHRDLVEDVQKTASMANHGVKQRDPLEVNTFARGPTNPLGESPVGIAEAGRVGEGENEQQSPDRPSVRNISSTSTKIKNQRPIARLASLKGGRKSDVRTTSTASENSSSSGLPLPSQLTRASSLRQPTDAIRRGDTDKKLHSRHTSVAESSAGSNQLRTFTTISHSQAREALPVRAQLFPPPKHLSATSKPGPAHRRSQSRGVTSENQSAEVFSGPHSRVTSLAKLQFSTYQQHFSPNKSKPQIELPKAPGSTSRGSTDLSHVTAPQDELLQLQWMFSSSHTTLQKWAESGERKIDELHKKHIQAASSVGAVEQRQQDSINGAILREWFGMNKGKLLLEKLETLAHCVQALTDLTQPHERLSRVNDQFEAWYENAVNVLNERSSGGQRENARFLLSLGHPWLETVAALVLSFESYLRHLRDLGLADKASGLGLVLDVHKRFTKSTLDQLNAMESIHSMVLNQEEDWIGCQISGIVGIKKDSELFPRGSKSTSAWDKVR